MCAAFGVTAIVPLHFRVRGTVYHVGRFPDIVPIHPWGSESLQAGHATRWFIIRIWHFDYALIVDDHPPELSFFRDYRDWRW
jgi:hypothetical protein